MALSEKLTAHTDPVLGSKQEDNSRKGGVSNLSWFYFSKSKSLTRPDCVSIKKGAELQPQESFVFRKESLKSMIDNLLSSKTSIQTSLWVCKKIYS